MAAAVRESRVLCLLAVSLAKALASEQEYAPLGLHAAAAPHAEMQGVRTSQAADHVLHPG